jgi:hypothetical protein
MAFVSRDKDSVQATSHLQHEQREQDSVKMTWHDHDLICTGSRRFLRFTSNPTSDRVRL